MRVRVRSPDCRTQFHERVHWVTAGKRVIRPFCHNETYIHRVEERTCHPHYSARD